MRQRSGAALAADPCESTMKAVDLRAAENGCGQDPSFSTLSFHFVGGQGQALSGKCGLQTREHDVRLIAVPPGWGRHHLSHPQAGFLFLHAGLHPGTFDAPPDLAKWRLADDAQRRRRAALAVRAIARALGGPTPPSSPPVPQATAQLSASTRRSAASTTRWTGPKKTSGPRERIPRHSGQPRFFNGNSASFE